MDNPILIFIAAFIFHLLADTLLHWNIYPWKFKSYPYTLVVLDILAGLVATYFLTGKDFFTLSVWAAIAGGNAPDVMHGIWEKIPTRHQDNELSWIKPFFVWHDKLQLETPSVAWGLLSQIVVIGISLVLIFAS